MKERIVSPDVIVNLKTMANLNQVTTSAAGVGIGGQTTLDTISRHDTLRKDYTVLAEAGGSAATPQIRNVGTIAGNVCQRPWCWYYRNGFQCYKNGGNRDGTGSLPICPHRARRRRTDSLAAARGGADAHGPAHHRGTRREGE